MDPLALLSDAEDEDGEAEEAPATESQGGAGGRAADGTAEEPVAKRQKTEDKVDFSDLLRLGYDVTASEESEKVAAAEALNNTFAAFQQATKQAEKQPAAAPVAPTTIEEEADFEAGCEPPPDSIEVYDESCLEVPSPWSTFEDAEEGLTKDIVDVMRSTGFEKPTPIQASTWPILSSGRDLIGVAKTGSGKTLAFLLPCFARLMKEGLRSKTSSDGVLPVQMQKQAAGPGAYSPEILVLAPSRELASQIETEAAKFTKVAGVTTLACYGGGQRAHQLGRLREQPECVVGTVGRLHDFLECERHWFGVRTVRFLVLDEADHMLGEGLSTQIRAITTDVETPRRQTMMFSATFKDDVRDLASWILRNPVEVRVGLKDPLRANPDVDQRILIVKDELDKEGALKNLLRMHYAPHANNPGKVLIFAIEPDVCDILAKKLKGTLVGAEIETLHGNKKQDDRERAIMQFRSGDVPVLIATNVAGRGLDIKDVKMVINFDPPEDGGDYVHRIGRTGRAGQKGTAVTLLRKGPDGRAMAYIAQVMRRTGKDVPQELIDALKQRRGRDMEFARQLLEGLCNFEAIQREHAGYFGAKA